MRALTTRPRRFAVGVAVLSAVALGTVSASATSPPSDTSHPATHKGDEPKVDERFTFAVLYTPTKNAPDDVNDVNDDFAACMTEHKSPSVPVFHAGEGEDGGILLQVRAGARKNETSTSQKQFQKALKSCAPILKKVGITVSTDPDDLPPRSKGPGSGGGQSGKDGQEADNGTPSLSRHT